MGSREGVLEVADGVVWVGLPPVSGVRMSAVGLSVEGVRAVSPGGAESCTPWDDVLGVRMGIRARSRLAPAWLVWPGRALLVGLEVAGPTEADPLPVRLDLSGSSLVLVCRAHTRGGYPPAEVRVAHGVVSALVELPELRAVLRDPHRLLEIAARVTTPARGRGGPDAFTRLVEQLRAELAG